MTISQTKTMGMNMIPTAIVQDLKMKKKWWEVNKISLMKYKKIW
jgi:hypothetical protein